MHAQRPPRLLAFLVWFSVGLSAVYWGLRLGEPAPVLSAQPAAALPAPAAIDAAALQAVLGGAAAASAPSPRRFDLQGVVTEGRQGVALLSVDGQPARPYRVGALVEGELRLAAVGPRRAELADARTGAVVQRLDMPAPASAPLPAGLTLVPTARP